MLSLFPRKSTAESTAIGILPAYNVIKGRIGQSRIEALRIHTSLPPGCNQMGRHH